MTVHRVALAEGGDLAGFRQAVRTLAAQGADPQQVLWSIGGERSLFGCETQGSASPLRLPRGVGELIELVVCHRDPECYALLYALVWRVLHGERELLEVQSDPLVHRLEMMRKAIRRDLHKMTAFLRFRRVEEAGGERFVAWFEPDHYILAAVSGFFVDRFCSLLWSILTPVGSLHWDRATLVLGPPARRDDAPAADEVEAGWLSYYASVFNPARINPKAMRAEMPKKYWRNLPEAALIPDLIQSSSSRVDGMMARQPTHPIKRDPRKAVAAMADQGPKTLAELNRVIQAAEPLVPGSTQAVLGEGPPTAPLVFVGEQPGDQEDLAGRPFVGPAGQLLRRTMAEAGIDTGRTYLTNAVKHFKFEQRGKKRIHQKPTLGEVKHYRWWLKKELELIKPKLVVALGATAAYALAGKSVSVTRSRGETQFDGMHGYITVHPSYLLRLPDEASKRREHEAFLSDMKTIRGLAERLQAA